MEATRVNPFELNGANAFFRGGRRQELLEYIRHLSLNLHPFVILSGRSGVGKSTLLAALPAYFEQVSQRLIMLDMSDKGSAQHWKNIYSALSNEMTVGANTVKSDLARGSAGASGNVPAAGNTPPAVSMQCTVCIDHANTLDNAQLLELISLSALSQGRVRFIIVADAEFMKRINSAEFKSNNVVTKAHVLEIPPFSARDIQRYIGFRLNLVGYNKFKYSDGELAKIVKRSKGLPGEVNKIAYALLVKKVNNKPGALASWPKLHLLAFLFLLFSLLWVAFSTDWGIKGYNEGSNFSGDGVGEGHLPSNDGKEIKWRPIIRDSKEMPETSVIDAKDAAIKQMVGEERSPEDPLVVAELPEDAQINQLAVDIGKLEEPVDETGLQTNTSIDTEQVHADIVAAEPSELGALVESKRVDLVAGNQEPMVLNAEPSKIPVESDALSTTQKQRSLPSEDDKTAQSVLDPIPSKEFDQLKDVEHHPLLDIASDHYTIQLMSGRDKASIQRMMKNLKQEYRFGQVDYYKGERGGAPWYVLLLGDYQDRAQAAAALAKFPKALKQKQPWVRPMTQVHKQIKDVDQRDL